MAAWIVLEIWLLILVAEAAGGLTVCLLLIAGVILGAYVIKRAGRRAWQRFGENLRQVQHPGEQPGAGSTAGRSTGGGNTLPMLGGMLLMMPGLLSDVAGLLCLFPPTRAVIRRTAERTLARRIGQSQPGGLGEAYQRAWTQRPDGKIVRGEVVRDGERPEGKDERPGRPDEHRGEQGDEPPRDG